MKTIKPSYEILTPISTGGIKELKQIERIGRVCYKSEDKISEDGESAKRFVKMLIDNGHKAMIENAPSLSVLFMVDRGVSHEIVRHRIASFAQSSTRYCDYSKGKFGSELTFIEPCFFGKDTKEYNAWKHMCGRAEDCYLTMREMEIPPEQARSILPNSLMTEITMTANYREWRNFFKLRTDIAAHPQMREVTIPLLDELKTKIPIIFDDIKVTDEARNKGTIIPF